ncbi:MAG: helix-turn-helix domain-containing protein [Candidatus Dadabacteria bacterium]|nr:MAG: helix-turn-helix domain-containing protein [Candidatus Dadabacteria bacterium]
MEEQRTNMATRHIGDRLRFLRHELDSQRRISQRELAEWMGVGVRVVQAYERGEASPGADKIARLVRTLRRDPPDGRIVRAEWLLTGEGRPFTPVRTSVPVVDEFWPPTVVARRGKLHFVTENAARLLGYPPEQMLGCDSLDFVEPDSRQRIEREIPDGYDRPYCATLRTANQATIDVVVYGRNLNGPNRRLLHFWPVSHAEAIGLEALGHIGEDVRLAEAILDIVRGRRAVERLSDL